MLEETGLLVEPGRLLYLWDYLPGNGTHAVHVTFEARRVGGALGAVTPGKDTRPIRGVEFVPVVDLPSSGFDECFAELPRARLVHGGRRRRWKLPANWPWSEAITRAWQPGHLHARTLNFSCRCRLGDSQRQPATRVNDQG